MRPNFIDVLNFHRKFGVHIGERLELMNDDDYLFRWNFMQEEKEEYDNAWKGQDLVKAIDSLIDLCYVVYGTGLFMGVQQGYPWPGAHLGVLGARALGFDQLRATPKLLSEHRHQWIMTSLIHELRMFASAHRAMHDPIVAVWHLTQATMVCHKASAMMGIPWQTCWDLVHEANMRKIRTPSADSSKRNSAWDVIKPEGWTSPETHIRYELQCLGAEV